MFKLPIRTWVCNAAAVFSGPHGAVTRQAREAECSRETVYEHARKLEQRIAAAPVDPEELARLRAENQRLRQELADLRRDGERAIRLDKPEQRRLATVAFASGVSTRQVEGLLALLLSESSMKAPDHSTVGRWIDRLAKRAGKVLEALDARCAPRVRTLCLDEVFFGGGRPWWGSSRRA